MPEAKINPDTLNAIKFYPIAGIWALRCCGFHQAANILAQLKDQLNPKKNNEKSSGLSVDNLFGSP